MIDFFNVLGDIATYLSVAVSLLYMLCFKKQGSAYRYLSVYLLIVGVVQLWAYYLGRGGAYQNNLHLSHYYFVVQFVCLSMFYKELLNKKWIQWIMLLVLAFIAFQFINDPDLYYRYNPWGIVVTTLPIVIYSAIYLLKGINSKSRFSVVSAGILIYLLSSLLIFAAGNVVIDLDVTKETKQIINHVNKVLYVLFLGILIYEWFANYNCFKQEVKS